jgi:hypothetical protein
LSNAKPGDSPVVGETVPSAQASHAKIIGGHKRSMKIRSAGERTLYPGKFLP